jgi:hypothetical protein
MAVDGRQENEVLNFPIVQRARTRDKASRGCVSGRMGSDSANGWSRRNFGCYGAHILAQNGGVGSTGVSVSYGVLQVRLSVVGWDDVCILHAGLHTGRRPIVELAFEWLLLLSGHKSYDEE